MAVVGQLKREIIEKHRQHANDSGSSEVQVALLTTRIDQLTEHFNKHKKDHASRRGLLRLVSQRRRLLEYVKNLDQSRYSSLIKKLGIRK